MLEKFDKYITKDSTLKWNEIQAIQPRIKLTNDKLD